MNESIVNNIIRSCSSEPLDSFIPKIVNMGTATLATCSPSYDPLVILKNYPIPCFFVLKARMLSDSNLRNFNNAQYYLEIANAYLAIDFRKNNLTHMHSSDITELARLVCSFAEHSHHYGLAISFLKNVLQDWAPSLAHMTSLHPLLTKICLLAKNLSPAFPILDHHLSEVLPKKYCFDIEDFLLYTYYGGIIYAAAKKFDKAMNFFHLCICSPASVASSIQVDAYQKYALVSLILHGRVLQLPKYLSAPVKKAIAKLPTAYTDYSQACESCSHSAAKAELEKHSELFQKHDNFGLAQQCLDSMLYRSILQLTDSYSSLSLIEIAKAVNIGDSPQAVLQAEHHLLKMIEKEQIFATISDKDGGTVFFNDPPEKNKSIDTMKLLNNDISKISKLNQSVIKMDRLFASSKDFLQKVYQNEGRNNNSFSDI